ncbi:MAG: NAD-dependent epimerase/dehydratase family protein [Solirubrobacterales bacterium]
MKVLVTGATGKVGHAVATALLERGDDVRALVRDPARAAALLPAGVEPVHGDVTEPGTLPAAVTGAAVVFNAMGIPEQWRADEGEFERVNAEGSAKVARAARGAGVRRFVHTSTNDVFDAEQGQSFDETMLADQPKGTAYERSKQHAEELVLAERDGIEVVILNPVGVYGPGPSASVSFDEDMFRPLVRGRLPALPPGGMGLVYTRGVAEGHLLAADRAPDGERYILSDAYVTTRELAEKVVAMAGRGRVPPTMPRAVARTLAVVGEGVSKLIRRPPLISRGQLYYFNWQARADSSKAQRELGWNTTPLDEGLRRTLDSLGLMEG